MSRVFRYRLAITDQQIIDMPLGTKLLSVAPARDGYYVDLWALTPEAAPKMPHTFLIVGTGNPMPQATLEFIGTAVMGDSLVWHVFHRPDQMKK